jgi:hypothetical protein
LTKKSLLCFSLISSGSPGWMVKLSEDRKCSQATAFSILRKGIPHNIVQTIASELDAINAASDNHDGSLKLSKNAVKLWDGIVRHSHGPITATAGFDRQKAIRTWKYPTDSSLTHVERAALAIKEQSDLCQRAADLDSTDFPHTQAQACKDILGDLPTILVPNERAYRS